MSITTKRAQKRTRILVGLFASLFIGSIILFILSQGGAATQMNATSFPSAPHIAQDGLDWQVTWGGANEDRGNSLTGDEAGHFYFAGVTDSYGEGGEDAFLAKFAANGTSLWNHTWGGVNNDGAQSVAINATGAIFLAGYTQSYAVNFNDMFVAIYDPSGDQVRNWTWGDVGDEVANASALDNEGNIYIAGRTNSSGAGRQDALLAKFAINGTLLWNRTWGGPLNDGATSVKVDGAGNVYLAGYIMKTEFGDFDGFLAKYDSSGISVWNRTWGGSDKERVKGLAMDDAGFIYMTGETGSYGVGLIDVFLAKYTASGLQIWNVTWGGMWDDQVESLAIDNTKNLYLAGWTKSYGGNGDAFIIKFASNGTLLGNVMWGGPQEDRAYCVAVNSSTCIILGGWTLSYGVGGRDAFLVKFSSIPPPTPSLNMLQWSFWTVIGSVFFMISAALVVENRARQAQAIAPDKDGRIPGSRTALANSILSIIVVEVGIGVWCFTGFDQYYLQNAHVPDLPVLAAMAFVFIGLTYEAFKSKTEWKMRKEMIPFVIASAIVAIWTTFNFNLMLGRYTGGPTFPFDAHFIQVYPIYTFFRGTFFFGFFPALYFLFKPSANAIVGATIYNLLCLIVVPIETAFGLWQAPYIEGYIMQVLGLVMFAFWYKHATSDERKFLNRFNSLKVVLIACAIATGVIATLLLSGIIQLTPGVLG